MTDDTPKLRTRMIEITIDVPVGEAVVTIRRQVDPMMLHHFGSRFIVHEATVAAEEIVKKYDEVTNELPQP